jgi:hypothetical protein
VADRILPGVFLYFFVDATIGSFVVLTSGEGAAAATLLITRFTARRCADAIPATGSSETNLKSATLIAHARCGA